MAGDGTVTVVDVKAASRLRDPEVRAQFSWTRTVAASRGWGFEAWSGADRRLLDNVRFLAGYRRSLVIDAGLLPVVLHAAREQATIGSVERALAGEYPVALVRPAVLHLLWTGRLRADLRRPLGAATPVQPAAGARRSGPGACKQSRASEHRLRCHRRNPDARLPAVPGAAVHDGCTASEPGHRRAACCRTRRAVIGFGRTPRQ